MSEPVAERALPVEHPLGHTAAPAPAAEAVPPATARQQAMVALGRRATALRDTTVFLEESAAMVAAMLGVEHSASAEWLPAGARLRISFALRPPGVAEPRNVLDEVDVQGRQSLAAYALEVGRPVIVTDWTRERRFADPLLERLGIQSALAVPLQAEDQSFGALVAGSHRVHPFTDDDLLFAENIAYLVTATVARRKTEEALEEERSLSAGLLGGVGAVVLVLDPDGRVLRVNKACQQLTGFCSDELRGRAIDQVFPIAGKPELFQGSFQKLRSGASPVEYESSLVTKDASRRHIAWTYSGVTDSEGQLERIIATGIDITEQRQAEQQLKEMGAAGGGSGEASGQAPEAGKPQTAGQPSSGRKPRGGPAAVANEERRRSARRAYPYHQAIGYILDGRRPRPADFYPVQCNDIAADGFSYLSTRPPQSDMLVVALGQLPRLTYLEAQVVHATRVEHDGQRLFLVGCAYQGRVHY